MSDWLAALDSHWAWLGMGVFLAIAELLAPGYFMIWLSAAALLTGVITLALPIGLPLQVGVFVVLAALSLAAGRRWLARNPIESADPLLNNRGGQLVGQTAVVTHAIDGGSGRVRHGDSEWLVRGPDAQPGTRVRIAGYDGAVLIVEHLN